MSVRRFTATLAVLAVAVGVSASAVIAAQGSAQATRASTIKVSALDSLKFTLSKKTAPAGVVKFVVTNKGNAKHDFSIAGKKTKQLGHNQSQTLTVTLKKKSYPYMCTLPGHAAAGMKGTFKAT